VVTNSPDNNDPTPSEPGKFITCRQLIDFLGDYVEGELPPPDRHELERHLAVCPSCVAYLDSYVKTQKLGRAALRDEAGATQVPEDLVRRILLARSAAAAR
jgi:anti-sigma factor RsiW